jgi:hypothetical protein
VRRTTLLLLLLLLLSSALGQTLLQCRQPQHIPGEDTRRPTPEPLLRLRR